MLTISKTSDFTLREKCPYLELFWSVFSPNAWEIRTRITPNTDTFHAVSSLGTKYF